MPSGVILLAWQNYTTPRVCPKSYPIKYLVSGVKILYVLEILWGILILCQTYMCVCMWVYKSCVCVYVCVYKSCVCEKCVHMSMCVCVKIVCMWVCVSHTTHTCTFTQAHTHTHSSTHTFFRLTFIMLRHTPTNTHTF